MAAKREAGDEVEAVLADLLATAADLIERDGGFHPFGARWREGDAAPELVRPVADEDYPQAPAVLAELVEALRMEAGAGLLRCGGTCADVVVELPDVGPTAAARAAVEHRDGPGRIAYLPYRTENGRCILGDLVATPAEAVIFGPTAS